MTKIKALDAVIGENYQLFHGDCVEVMRQLPPASVDFAVYSPPFSNLYCYGPSECDMGNSVDDRQFLAHYRFLVDELLRVLRPGRLAAIHCKDLVNYKGRDGMAGLRDFPGDLIRVHQEAGFAYHSKVTIWKCPVTEMTRTKAHGLLYKQLRADSSFSRQGLAEYVVVVRKWPRDGADEALVQPVTHTTESFPLAQWQQWASPVWMDIDDMDVLNVRQARDSKDEKHMCVARGSLVCTYNGYRPIEDVVVGDVVLTHRGRWRCVTAKQRMGSKRAVRLTAQGVADLQVTPDHRIWTRIGGPPRLARALAKEAAPTWVRADETLSHYVALPLPPVETSPLTADEWWIVGRWLGDGHMSARGLPFITCAHDELPELVAKLGSRAGAAYSGPTASQIYVKGREGRGGDLLHRTIERCGRGAAGKVVPGEALALGQEKAEALLTGYLSADGYLVESCGTWQSMSVSRALVLGMAMIAQRARGIVATICPGRKARRGLIDGREVAMRAEWVLSIPRTNASGFVDGDGWKKVRDLADAGDVEVWDLQVDEDESFVAEGCAVHNCPLALPIIERCLGLWSNPGDVVLSPFAGIGSEGFQALKMRRRFLGIELKDTYFAHAKRNLEEATRAAGQGDLFAGASP